MFNDSKNFALNRAQRRHPGRPGGYITINQAAEYLGVTARTIRTMIADGRLIGYRMGNRFIRLDLDEIDAAMVPTGGGAA